MTVAGATHVLRAGDVFYTPAGEEMTWEVAAHVQRSGSIADRRSSAVSGGSSGGWPAARGSRAAARSGPAQPVTTRMRIGRLADAVPALVDVPAPILRWRWDVGWFAARVVHGRA